MEEIDNMDVVAKLEKMAQIFHQMREDLRNNPNANLNDSVRKIDPELADIYLQKFKSASVAESEIIELTKEDYTVENSTPDLS